jgi:hypothetical protein
MDCEVSRAFAICLRECGLTRERGPEIGETAANRIVDNVTLGITSEFPVIHT